MLNATSTRFLTAAVLQALFASSVALAADPAQEGKDAKKTDAAAVAEQRDAKQDKGKAVPVELQSIQVTATRRSEDLLDVPISANVISPGLLKEANLRDFNNIQYVEPSLNVLNFSGTSRLTLRGQGGFDPGASPAVVGYFNEVPMPITGGPISGAIMAGGFYDLENIQVLKGPQGTLFGRNTTGGAILFTTQRPTNEFGGYVEQTIGNYDNRATEFAINVPVVDDKLLVRLSGRRHTRDGYTWTLGTPSHPEGLDLDNANSWSTRLSVTLKPVEGVQNDTIVERYVSRTNNVSGMFGYVVPHGSLQFMYPSVDFNALIAQQQALGERTQLPINVDPFNKMSHTAISNISSIAFNDNLTLRNVFGYYLSNTSLVFDGDGTPVEIYEFPLSYPRATKRTQLTEELQLLGTSLDGKLEWVAGGFMLHQPKSDPDLMTYTVFGGSKFGATLTSTGISGADSRAAYGQGTYDMSSWVRNLKLTLGVRKSWDQQFGMGLPKQSVCLVETENPKCYMSNSATNWTVALTYAPTDNRTYYASVRRGYRSGGINSVADEVPGLPATYPPEYVTAWELGFKTRGRLAGMPARMSVAAYYQDYVNIHHNRTVVLPDKSTRIIASSGATAEMFGMDFDASISPLRGLQLGASFSWINLAYRHFDPTLTPLEVATIKQGKINYRPRFKYDAFARYSVPLANSMGDLAFYAGWSWQAHNGFNNPPGTVFDPYTMRDSVGMLNLSADWNNVGFKPIDISFYVTNATDRLVRNGQLTVAKQMGFSTYNYLPPRMFGLSVRYRFGE